MRNSYSKCGGMMASPSNSLLGIDDNGMPSPQNSLSCAGNYCVECHQVWNPRWNQYDMVCTHYKITKVEGHAA